MIRTLLFLLPALFTAGCASTTPTGAVSLRYTVAGTQTAEVPRRVALFKISDAREDSNLGAIHSGFARGSKSLGPARDNAAKWVTDALEGELSNAGYTVVNAMGPGVTNVAIDGQVSDIHIEPKEASHECRITVFIRVRRGETEVLHKSFQASESQPGLGATGGTASELLTRTLQQLMRSVVPAVLRAVEQPE